MNRFELARHTATAQARELLAEKPGSVLKAGGIDVVDHLKEHLLEPPRLVDLKTISGLDEIDVEPDGSLRIGALVTLAQVAAHDGDPEEPPRPRPRLRRGGLAPDPQRGHHRRQPPPAAALLVLPPRVLQVHQEGRRHLLRHRRREPLPRDLRRRARPTRRTPRTPRCRSWPTARPSCSTGPKGTAHGARRRLLRPARRRTRRARTSSQAGRDPDRDPGARRPRAGSRPTPRSASARPSTGRSSPRRSPSRPRAASVQERPRRARPGGHDPLAGRRRPRRPSSGKPLGAASAEAAGQAAVEGAEPMTRQRLQGRPGDDARAPDRRFSRVRTRHGRPRDRLRTPSAAGCGPRCTTWSGATT